MNDQDKEAYEKYLVENNVNQRQIWNELSLDEIWQAACEYKQKEIDELNSHVKFQSEVMCDMGEVVLENKKLQAENEELKKQIYVEGSIHKEGNKQREMTWKESSDMMERIVESRTKLLEEARNQAASLALEKIREKE